MLSLYPRMIEGAGPCRYVNYVYAPMYTVTRMQKGAVEAVIPPGETHLIFRPSDGRKVATVFPLIPHSPAEFYALLREVLSTYSSLSNVPLAYAKGFGKMGYKIVKRPWGAQDFIWSTENLISYAGGANRSHREQINRIKRRIEPEFRDLLFDDIPALEDLNARWGAGYTSSHDSKLYHIGALVNSLVTFPYYPSAIRYEGRGAWADGKLIGASFACLIHPEFWANCFRITDRTNKELSGLSHVLLQDMAQRYADIPYECDGNGGAVGSPLYHFKARLVSPDVLHKQHEMFVVAK